MTFVWFGFFFWPCGRAVWSSKIFEPSAWLPVGGHIPLGFREGFKYWSTSSYSSMYLSDWTVTVVFFETFRFLFSTSS